MLRMFRGVSCPESVSLQGAINFVHSNRSLTVVEILSHDSIQARQKRWPQGWTMASCSASSHFRSSKQMQQDTLPESGALTTTGSTAIRMYEFVRYYDCDLFWNTIRRMRAVQIRIPLSIVWLDGDILPISVRRLHAKRSSDTEESACWS